MKKIIFFTVILCAMVAGAQDFVGKHVELLDGKELQVMKATELQKQYGIRGFYTDAKLNKIYKPKTYSTKAEALEGKIFKLVSYEPYMRNYIFKLENKETGTLYYKYDETDYFNFPFEVVGGGVTIPESLACSWVSLKDDFIDVRYTYSKWYQTVSFDDMHIGLSEDKQQYYMKVMINNVSAASKVAAADVVLFLSDNTRITFPNVALNAKPAMKDYDYIAVLSPSAADVEKLKSAKILKIQIGDHTRDIGTGNLFMHAVRCLAKLK